MILSAAGASIINQTCNSAKVKALTSLSTISCKGETRLKYCCLRQTWKLEQMTQLEGRSNRPDPTSASLGSPCCRFIGRFRRTKSRSWAKFGNRTFATSRNCLWGFSSRVSSKNDSSRVLNTQQNFSNTNTPNTLHILQCPVKNSYQQLTSLLQKPVPSQIQRKDCFYNHMSNPTAPEPFWSPAGSLVSLKIRVLVDWVNFWNILATGSSWSC